MKLLSSRRRKLVGLKKKKCEIQISRFWESASGLPVDLDFDVWFAGEAKKKRWHYQVMGSLLVAGFGRILPLLNFGIA